MLDSVDRDVAPGDRGQADEAADLDVIGPDLPLAASQPLDALDAEDVRLDAFDLRAERDEEPAEILDMRFAGRVADDGLSGRERRRHHGVLRRHDARLVQEDRLAAQRTAPELVPAADVDLRAELGECVDVRIEPPPTDHVTAGRRRTDMSNTCEQRTGE